ncbi:MFS family permease [Arcanobacterium wilhelmae]|uniref:MFS family permease n=1 Tax=Arcanobacterium wilhelmae TaxID=1803177 RepID=A0ABT9N8M6_9ACTO|nr:MFS transporter [Arcanobacterium wilhelmae]MDP9800050.1 MFS family permease [Arcanobacterium wilhelmae]
MSIKEEFTQSQSEYWLKMMSVILISLIAFETIAVTTVMPYVVDLLNGKNLYALASGITLTTQLITTALAGRWADNRGPNQPLLTGAALFIAGLLIISVAPTVEVVVLGRAVQGLGSGLVVVPLFVLVGAHVPSHRQPALFATFAAAWVVPSLLGPAIAGLMVEYLHWRVVFAAVPLILLAMFPMLVSKLRQFPDTHDPHKRFRLGDTFTFALLVGISVGALQMLSALGDDGFKTWALAMIVICSAAAFFFVRPLVPQGTLSARRGVPSIVLLRGIVYGAYFAVEIYLPLMLKNVHNWGPKRAGLVLAAGAVTWALGSYLQSQASEDRRKHIPTIGLVLQLVGSAISIAGSFHQITGIVVILGWLIAGLGTGLTYPLLLVFALGRTPKSRHGKISAAAQIADNMGAAACIAYAGIAYSMAVDLGHWAFLAAISTMVVLLIAGLVVSRRLGLNDPLPEEMRGELAAETATSAESADSEPVLESTTGDPHDSPENK